MAAAMQETYRADVNEAQAELTSHFSDHPELEVAMLLQARRDALVAEQSAIGDMLQRGFVGPEVGHSLTAEIHRRMAALELIEERWESNIAPPGDIEPS